MNRDYPITEKTVDPERETTYRREWTCSECGETLMYPDTPVLLHYNRKHRSEYDRYRSGGDSA